MKTWNAVCTAWISFLVACGTETGNPDIDQTPIKDEADVLGGIDGGVEESMALASDMVSSSSRAPSLNLTTPLLLETQKTCAATADGGILVTVTRADSGSWTRPALGGMSVSYSISGEERREWRHASGSLGTCLALGQRLTRMDEADYEGLSVSIAVETRASSQISRARGARSRIADVSGSRSILFESLTTTDTQLSVSMHATSQVTRRISERHDGVPRIDASFVTSADLRIDEVRSAADKRLLRKEIKSGEISLSSSAKVRSVVLRYSEEAPVVWERGAGCAPVSGKVEGVVTLKDGRSSAFSIDFGDGTVSALPTITFANGESEPYLPTACASGAS